MNEDKNSIEYLKYLFFNDSARDEEILAYIEEWPWATGLVLERFGVDAIRPYALAAVKNNPRASIYLFTIGILTLDDAREAATGDNGWRELYAYAGIF